MPKIMIRCPTLGAKVPTGLTTEMVVFGSLPAKIKMPLRCPTCRNVHEWGPEDAWVDKALSVTMLHENDGRPRNRERQATDTDVGGVDRNGRKRRRA